MPRKIQHTDILSSDLEQKSINRIRKLKEDLLKEYQALLNDIKSLQSQTQINPITSSSIQDQQKITQLIGLAKQMNIELQKITESINNLSAAKTKSRNSTQQLSDEERIAQQIKRSLAREEAKLTQENIKRLAQIKKTREAVKQQVQDELKLDKTYKSRPGLLKRLTAAVTAYVAAWLGIQTVIRIVNTLFQTTKKLDSLRFSMEAVITDSKELERTQRFLVDIARSYGQELISLSESYVRFRATTQNTNLTLKQTRDIFDTIVKTSAVLGLSAQRTELALLAIEQIASKGTVSMEELRRQLGDQIPSAVPIMARALNVAIPELYKMIKANKVLAEDALPKFAEELKKTFGLNNISRVETLQAATGRLRLEWQLFIKDLNAGETFTGVINFLTVFLRSIKEGINPELKSTRLAMESVNNEMQAFLDVTNFDEIEDNSKKLEILQQRINKTRILLAEYILSIDLLNKKQKEAFENLGMGSAVPVPGAPGTFVLAGSDADERIKSLKFLIDALEELRDEISKDDKDEINYGFCRSDRSIGS